MDDRVGGPLSPEQVALDIGEAIAESGIGVGVWGDVTKRNLAATEIEAQMWEAAYRKLWTSKVVQTSGREPAEPRAHGEPSEAAIEAAERAELTCNEGSWRQRLRAAVRAAYAVDGVRAVDSVGPEPRDGEVAATLRRWASPLRFLKRDADASALETAAEVIERGGLDNTFTVGGRPTSSTDGADK